LFRCIDTLMHYAILRSLNKENQLPVKFKMADGSRIFSL